MNSASGKRFLNLSTGAAIPRRCVTKTKRISGCFFAILVKLSQSKL